MPAPPPSVLGVAARSGTGKTTLLRALIPLLREAGLRLALAKHSHHELELDRPGKDSHRLRLAGAAAVLVCSGRRTALIDTRPEPWPLAASLAALAAPDIDLILVEGFKGAPIPKLELHRPALGAPPLFPHDRHIIAVACDAPLDRPCALPLLDLNAPPAIAAFVLARLQAGALVTAP